MVKLLKSESETFEDYFVRLSSFKMAYHITWEDIADLLNNESEIQYNSCTYKKKWQEFSKGMNYQKKLNDVGVSTRILALSDFHIPFQYPVDIFSEYVGCVDVLVLNGDILDCQSLSKFPKTYSIPFFEELITARQYIIDLIELIQPKQVKITYGNHDNRLNSYLAKHLDTDMIELLPDNPLDLIINDGFNHYDKRNHTKTWYDSIKLIFKDKVEVIYESDWKCMVGNTLFVHPLAYSQGILKTAEKALMFFRNEGYKFDALIMAHTHRLGSFTYGNTTIYEQGCCCKTKMNDYHNGKLVLSQIEGYMYICQDKNGNIILDKTKLIKI